MEKSYNKYGNNQIKNMERLTNKPDVVIFVRRGFVKSAREKSDNKYGKIL